MALVLELGKLDGLKNENAEWLCHFKFRDAKKESKPATGKATVDFGDCVRAPVLVYSYTLLLLLLCARMAAASMPGSDRECSF